MKDQLIFGKYLDCCSSHLQCRRHQYILRLDNMTKLDRCHNKQNTHTQCKCEIYSAVWTAWLIVCRSVSEGVLERRLRWYNGIMGAKIELKIHIVIFFQIVYILVFLHVLSEIFKKLFFFLPPMQKKMDEKAVVTK